MGETRDSLAPWYVFIRGNASFLGAYPAAFFQQAYNEASDGPVSQAAQQRWDAARKASVEHQPPVSSTSPRALVPTAFLEWLNRPSAWEPPACLMTLPGHTNSVTSVALSADGQTIVSVSLDYSVKIWDARSGECHALRGHTGYVDSVALSADGQTIVAVSGSGDENSIKIWDAGSGECRATFPRDSAEAQAAWKTVGRNDKSHQLSTAEGLLHFPLPTTLPAARPSTSSQPSPTAVSELVFPGLFTRAHGPLADETLLAFTANGEAYWFRFRRRDQE